MIGPVGRTVIANIEQLRKAAGLSFRDLAARCAELDRTIGAAVLHRQSQGKRRVDADDLVAFAEVFGVTVADLLGPQPAAVAGHPAVIAVRALADRITELVAAADDPQAVARADRALRRVQIEVEELLADEGRL
jgi:transcriptional regulator with XRE-family HTH domain